MGIGMEINIILAYAFGLILLYIVGYVLLVPIKIVIKLVYNGIIGGIALLILNFIGGFFQIGIAINPITALVAGFLGVPGILLMLGLRYLL
ncbi:inhibitor of the pro-sigma K processing machinery [Geosporobacter subterraneus DSM 17957]|uniref:Inhibitor of the pro-sigma K processing machinery n=1 Tax=Geosporobacter subterraneus DSM 17957 TaxID=1121919 RepID=A0A1M6QCT7_9FIRM|nr:pro-sigmaK processing inhibitor BofA family protein [Geosporobacter subterraneus]SHK17991.1 inhibitor of the pro-sigma K processing machinery [Geosporobacter subterraneus DSM 17957]